MKSTTLQTHGANGSGHFHAVRFYKDSESLSHIVAAFLDEGLTRNDPGIVIATPAHRVIIRRHLEELSLDVDRLQQEGRLLMLDAEETLALFMVDGAPDPTRFTAALVPIIEQACQGRKDCVVRAYGEMVDVLWKAGQTVAATRVEMLWNNLAASHAFALLCGYAMGNFYKSAAVEDICSHHSHVVSAAGEATSVH